MFSKKFIAATKEYTTYEKRYPRITLEAGEHTYDVYKL